MLDCFTRFIVPNTICIEADLFYNYIYFHVFIIFKENISFLLDQWITDLLTGKTFLLSLNKIICKILFPHN